jgi:DNA-binding CsgD family transcriptional regulator
MKYISAAEASEKWGVSLRQVQRLLSGGRIPSAKKYGRAWMIPYDAEKPKDPRKSKKTGESLAFELAQLIEDTTIPMPWHRPDAVIDTVKDERARRQYTAELAYLRGDFARAMRCYRETAGDAAAMLRASLVGGAAAISTGDYAAFTEIEAHLKSCIQTGKEKDVCAVAELALASVAVSVIAPSMVPEWLKDGNFGVFPEQAKLGYMLFLRAKYFLCIGRYEAALTVAQTALAYDHREKGLTFPGIYLRVACALSYYSLAREDEAKRSLMEAMRIALPHGFITPFAEVVTALGGLVEQCLKQEFPQYHDAVLEQWKRTWKNWIAFHNQFTKDNITLMLSLREYHMAMLVARHIPYAKIAKQYGISVGRLKNIMLGIYQKLFISGRDELAKYVL